MSRARDLAGRLAARAPEVCAHYLSNGRRQGAYWRVGDVANAKGQSLYVRLAGDAAGKWTDAATGGHGDLLDLIRLNRQLPDLGAACREAEWFLGLPVTEPNLPLPVAEDATVRAQRLYARSRPLAGTLGETYLRSRGIDPAVAGTVLRFHPECFCRDETVGRLLRRPALIAPVTSLDGSLTGVHRTYLAPDGQGKAAMPDPRRSLGALLRHAVRIGEPDTVAAAGEGLETMLTLRTLLPALPVLAATSAGHLAAVTLPPGLLRIYVARDNDRAGEWAWARLRDRAATEGVEAVALIPALDDWNADLGLGADATRERLLAALRPGDRARFGVG